MRHPLVMGNWKLNGSKQITAELIAGLRKELSGVEGCGVAIAPPALYLEQAKHAISGSHIALGAQNVDVNLSGAFTGEVSAEMLKDIGAKYIIIGHSERRTYHKESDEFIAKKYAVLKSLGLVPVLCIAQAQAVHKFIRDHIAKKDAAIAEQVIIQYGGSVNDKNAAELFTQPDIDGALVGGASLKADAFAVIVKAAAAAKSA